MLRWIGRKYMEMQKVREENRKNCEAGFTLIELLVVVIIIGILAAIAIPTFLNQRNNAYEAQTKSSVRNAVTNAESYATTNNGSYLNLDNDDIRNGISSTNGVTVSVGGTPTATNFCIAGTNTNGGSGFHYDKADDTIAPGGC